MHFTRAETSDALAIIGIEIVPGCHGPHDLAREMKT